jgi:GH15 family glucan-1,4-alpha-glucosidase
MEFPAIEDHALLGDGRGAALVAKDGSINWLCWDRFDSPPLFAALLDRARGGFFRVAPVGASELTRSYRDGSNVLETRFACGDAIVRVTDAMTVEPDEELIRIVECDRGEVEIAVEYQPRPGFARRVPVVRDRGVLGLRVEGRYSLDTLMSDRRLEVIDGGARGRFPLRAGETATFCLAHADDAPAVLPIVASARERLERTDVFWRLWSRRAMYLGPHRDSVVRSLLTLKLLQFSPSGAIVAAPTTSLPERPGGDLNWDYRYCWLRDASMIADVLFSLGYFEEGGAFIDWLLHTTRLARVNVRPLYDVYGDCPPREHVLTHLSGYGGAQPIRIGNAAAEQLQLDVFGEVAVAAHHAIRAGYHVDSATRGLLRDLGRFIIRHAHDPDHGIWEPRVAPRHHTHSRLLSWAGVHALVEACEGGGLCAMPLDDLRAARARLRDEITTRAWNSHLGAYTGLLDGDELDAAVLLISYHGFEPANSLRMRSTWRHLRERLGAGGGLIHRYVNNLSPGEGAFGICSFWAVQYLAEGGGSLAEAEQLYRQLLAYRNDVGLYGEEIDTLTGGALGNFPQGFSHVGLISAALALEARVRADARATEEAYA